MADKLKMQSSDVIGENISFIESRWPNVVKEVRNEDGKLIKAVDFDALKQELVREVISDKQERYQMTWPDKKKAVLAANSSISGTLRPILEKSVDFDNTQNIYIEGDNLDVLKLLRETYLNKIKMIYIDPPYNTGSDFLYDDDFVESEAAYLEKSGQFDNQGNRLTSNTESNGRFHSDWLNMIFPRLKVAKDLLADDGVMIISIDEHEIHNLSKITSDLFDGDIDYLIWQKTDPWVDRNTNAKQISRFLEFKEFLVVLYKNKSKTKFNKIMRLPDWKNSQKNIDNDPRGNWQSGIFSYEEGHKNEDRESSSYFTIKLPSGREVTRMWFVKDKNEYDNLVAKGMLYFGPDGDSVPRIKTFEDIEKEYYLTSVLRGFGTSGTAKDEIKSLFDDKLVFDTPKPTKLIKELIRAITSKNDIVLDFFAGSGSTADAVFQLNSEENSSRKVILVQIPEDLDIALQKKTGDAKEIIKNAINVCDTINQNHYLTNVSEERIRRVGKKIKEENPLISQDLDVGFRVLKLDSSNMKDVYYNPKLISQDGLFASVDNVKEDRTSLDLLFQVMLELGIELSAKISEKEIDGKQVYTINDSYLVACFASEITENVIRECAKINPVYVVFRDNSFAKDSDNINCEQIIKTVSPSTELKVI